MIVPTRHRPKKVKEFYDVFVENSSISDLCFGIDDDDKSEYSELENKNNIKIFFDINPRIMMNGTLNLLANKYASQYEYIGFAGDDHRVKTKNWDKILVESISNIKYGIAYGNDTIQGKRLPTAVVMDSKIILTLGFMAPPKQKHLYLDNFWKDLGNSIGTLRYHPNVIIEHMHFTKGKSEKDALYAEVNDRSMYHHDRSAYIEYQKNQMQSDILKLKN